MQGLTPGDYRVFAWDDVEAGAWLDPESGKVFCLSSGPSKEAVLRVHDKAGHPTEEIYELAVEIV